MATTIEVITVIAAAREVVFDLELDVDVHAASMGRSQEQATTSTGSHRLGLGDEVTFTARHLGLRWRLVSAVTAYERPRRFVDEQVRGPFRVMRHEHLFEDCSAPGVAGTRMVDRMSLELPGGALGRLAVAGIAAPYLRRLLRRRGDHIRGIAESGARSA